MGDDCRLRVAIQNYALKQKELSSALAKCTHMCGLLKASGEKNNDITHIEECMNLIQLQDQLMEQLKDSKIAAQHLVIQEQNRRGMPGRSERVDSGVYSTDLETADLEVLARDPKAPRLNRESQTTATDENSVGTDISANGTLIAQCTGENEGCTGETEA